MAKKKTETEIDAEIAALRAIKPSVKRFSAFGDDHHRSIAEQIRTLERKFTEDDIVDYDSAEDYDAAYEAIQWRDGEAEEGLADAWKPLAS